MLEKISAKYDCEPCRCRWIGADGAGHFVKMVHNGIEYADMQIIAKPTTCFAPAPTKVAEWEIGQARLPGDRPRLLCNRVEIPSTERSVPAVADSERSVL